jgi:hypothetical protein
MTPVQLFFLFAHFFLLLSLSETFSNKQPTERKMGQAMGQVREKKRKKRERKKKRGKKGQALSR